MGKKRDGGLQYSKNHKNIVKTKKRVKENNELLDKLKKLNEKNG